MPRTTTPVSAPMQRLIDEFGSWLTVTEVAALLQVSKMTVYRLTDIDDLASIRVGKSIRITEEAVANYLRGGGSDLERYTPAPRRRLRAVGGTR